MFTKGDYIVAKTGRKKFFGLVKNVNDTEKELSVVIVKDIGTEKEEKIPVMFEDVLAWLGNKPLYGSVYGQKVELLKEELETKHWGTVSVYRELDDIQRDSIQTGFRAAHKLIKDAAATAKALDFISLRMPRGKYAGMYKKVGDEHGFDLFPKDEFLTSASFCDLLLHEHGHTVWYTRVPKKLKGSWVKLYHSLLVKRDISSKTALGVWEEFSLHEGTVQEFLSEREEVDVYIMNDYLSYVYDKNKLDEEDLNSFKENGGDLLSLVPDTGLVFSEQEGLPTDYAGVNTREFFAESFRLYLGGGALDKRVQKAMKKTLESLK